MAQTVHLPVDGLILFILAVIATAFVVAILIAFCALPPKSEVTGPANPIINLQQPARPNGIYAAFTNSPTGDIAVSTDAKPFAVTVVKDGPVVDAFLFSNLLTLGGGGLAPETASTSRGFTFAVAQPVTVVGLQVVDELFAAGERRVGVFLVSTAQALTTAAVSKAADPLAQGLRTRTLLPSEQVDLVPGVLYACVGLVLAGDLWCATPGYALPSNLALMDAAADEQKLGVGQVGAVTSSTLRMPTGFADAGTSPTSPFASLQLQRRAQPTQVFSADTQFARFPPGYARNFNVLVDDAATIRMTAGEASSVYDDCNLVMRNDEYVDVAGQLAEDTWYAIFAVAGGAGFTDGNDAHMAISPSFPELPGLANNFARRVGWARTRPFPGAGALYLMTQSGDGVRRTYTNSEPLAAQTAVALGNGGVAALRLGLCAPTASECTLQVEVLFPTTTPGATLRVGTADVVFRAGQNYQLQTVTIALSSDLIPHQVALRCAITGQPPAPPGPPDADSPTFTISVLSFTEDV